MRALVTGACGYIGSTLAKRLLKKGYQVRGFDLPASANRIKSTNSQHKAEAQANEQPAEKEPIMILE